MQENSLLISLSIRTLYSVLENMQLLDQTSTASCLEIVKDEEMENISYLPVCSDWQEERCHIR